MSQSTPQVLSWPAGNGDAPFLIRSFDWATNPLGPLEDWPQALRMMVDLVLASPVAAMVQWGPDRVQICNDPWMGFHAEEHAAAWDNGVRTAFLNWPTP